MSTKLPAKVSITGAIEKVLIGGDLSQLSEQDCLLYYKAVCKSVGLNPLTKPFDYLWLNGKKVLYANKGCAEQLRIKHKISVRITRCEHVNEIFVVTAEATNDKGRVDSATGAVNVGGLRGEALSNAMMKAETKAKRRVSLSICGLNMPDESELETIAGASTAPPSTTPATPASQARPPQNPHDPGNYVVQFGQKYKGIAIRDLAADELRDYVAYLKRSTAEQKKPLGGAVKEFVTNAEAYLAAKDDPESFQNFNEAS